MAQLPSYKEATTRPQWQVIVAPYVSVRDYASLCLVNRAFYDYFAPCLWKNPLEVLTIDKRDAYAGREPSFAVAFGYDFCRIHG